MADKTINELNLLEGVAVDDFLVVYDIDEPTVNKAKKTTVSNIMSAGTYTHTQSSSSTVWNVNHNLGSKYVIITCINSLDLMILPLSVNFIDDSNLTITFVDAISGHAVMV
jgi:hypothetical protein